MSRRYQSKLNPFNISHAVNKQVQPALGLPKSEPVPEQIQQPLFTNLPEDITAQVEYYEACIYHYTKMVQACKQAIAMSSPKRQLSHFRNAQRAAMLVYKNRIAELQTKIQELEHGRTH